MTTGILNHFQDIGDGHGCFPERYKRGLKASKHLKKRVTTVRHDETKLYRVLKLDDLKKLMDDPCRFDDASVFSCANTSKGNHLNQLVLLNLYILYVKRFLFN